jgi:16S rRNA (cytosine967-C5)-methyltransferase
MSEVRPGRRVVSDARSGTRATGVTPARACAFRVLGRAYRDGAYADRALQTEARGLEGRERALAQTLAYGAIQRRRTLDHVLARFSSRSLDSLDVDVRCALELGAYQLMMLDGVSPYAAVDESVELAKRTSPGGARLVNAILRRVSREGRALLAALDDATPERAAVLHSVPDWLARMWWGELGGEQARGLLATVNLPAESALRINTLRVTDSGAFAAGLAADIEPAPAWVAAPELPELPEALRVNGRFDAFASPGWRAGELMPQSRASMAVARVLAPVAGERVLDVCAAPGAKTTHASALMRGEGEIVAVELHGGRAGGLARSAERMGAGNVRVLQGDARLLCAPGGPLGPDGFDRVLVDPPCSGLGTLRSRPDLRWHVDPEQLAPLAGIQGELLATAAGQLRPGGALVYSVCTISRHESGDVVEAFLAGHPEFALDRSWLLLPHVEGSDGFYIARLHRR